MPDKNDKNRPEDQRSVRGKVVWEVLAVARAVVVSLLMRLLFEGG